MRISTRYAVCSGIWVLNGLLYSFWGGPAWLSGVALLAAGLYGTMAILVRRGEP